MHQRDKLFFIKETKSKVEKFLERVLLEHESQLNEVNKIYHESEMSLSFDFLTSSQIIHAFCACLLILPFIVGPVQYFSRLRTNVTLLVNLVVTVFSRRPGFLPFGLHFLAQSPYQPFAHTLGLGVFSRLIEAAF